MRFKQRFSAIDMTEGPPWKKLVLFTLPLLVGNLFQQLYSTVDAIMLGNFVGDYALAAVGSTMAPIFLITVLMMGIAMGAGVMVSQYFGAKQREELSRTIGNCITLTAIAGVMVMAIGLLFSRTLLVFLGTPPEILDDGVVYINVLLWGLLGMAYFNIFSGILRGVGDAFSPLLYLAIASVLNIILNFITIAGLGWGVMGAALGTVVSQALTSLLCLRRIRQMRDYFDTGLTYLRPQKQYVYQLLKLGVPTGISQAVFAVAAMAVQPLVNAFGPLVLAANVIVTRVDGFVMMPNFSFGNAMNVYAGQNMGAGKVERISKGTKQCAALAFGVALVLMLIILVFARQISGLFTQTEAVLDMSVLFLRILALGYLTFSVNMVLWGAIRGAGDAMTPMWASIINTIVIRVPVAYLLVYLIGQPVALMYSLLIAWVTNTVLAIIAYRRGKWRTTGIVKREENSAII